MYKTLTLKPNRDKSIRNQHPWIFSGGVAQMPDAQNGEIVAIQSASKEILGHGFFSSQSQITCRIFDFKKQDFADFSSFKYWQAKISNAYTLRKNLLANQKTDCYRLLHAEGDFFPGLIVDIYKDVAVLQVLIQGTEKLLPHIQQSLLKLGFKAIYLKNNPNARNIEHVSTEGKWLEGNKPENLIIEENGLRFKVDLETGQKTGFFLDQRENRNYLKTVSAGKKILNAFSYTGGFSVYAMAGNAKEVHSLDVSKDAVRMAEENAELNFPSSKNHKGIARDCFDYLRHAEEMYDLIVLDPPAFAKNSHSVNQASKGYKELNLQAFKKMNAAGIVFTFSCSQHIDTDLFRKIVFSAAADSGKEVRIIKQLSQPFDHPVNIYHPEGEYLKGLVLFIN